MPYSPMYSSLLMTRPRPLARSHPRHSRGAKWIGGLRNPRAAMTSFRGSKTMSGGNGVAPEVDPALYRNLVEMIPLMESFMEQQGSRTNIFGHQASMIYTPAPLRESLYKPYESPLKARKGIHTPKRTPNRELSRGEPKEECRWEESENILRRIEGDTAQEDSSKNIRHLLLEIEELKQKLWEKDCLLETIGQRSNQILESHSSQTDDVSQKLWETDALLDGTPSWQSKGTDGNDGQGGAFEFDSQPGNNATHGNGVSEDEVEKSGETKLLKTEVDMLRQELAEKDCYVQSAQLELCEQQQGLGEMRLLLEQAERGLVKTNHKANSMEAELNTLRCQVLTLRYQLDAVDATDLADGGQFEQQDVIDREGPPYRVDMVSTIASEEVDQKTTFLVCVSGPNDEEQVSTVSEGSKEEKEKLELARRKYLAAVTAAREKPIGESLLMAAECRKQLNNYLKDLPVIQGFGTQL